MMVIDSNAAKFSQVPFEIFDYQLPSARIDVGGFILKIFTCQKLAFL